MRRRAAALVAACALLLAGLAAPAQAVPDYRDMYRQYWLMQASRACAGILSSDVNDEAKPFLYRICIRDWLAANAPPL